MTGRDDVRRVLARCDECDAVYAARRWPDGTVQPIGRNGCQCGSGRFTVVDGAGAAAGDAPDEGTADDAGDDSVDDADGPAPGRE